MLEIRVLKFIVELFISTLRLINYDALDPPGDRPERPVAKTLAVSVFCLERPTSNGCFAKWLE